MSDIAVAESGTRLQNFLDRAGLRGFPWKTATILYTISWGWLFIVRDSYWADDWDLLVYPELEAAISLRSLGAAPWLIVNNLAFEYFGPALFRFCTFGLYLCSSIFLFGILGKNSIFSMSQRRCVALLFLILPFNSARIMNITFGYAEAYFLFFAAWYALNTFNSRKSRFIACILFFLSFQMFTLIAFFILPVSHLYFLERGGSLRDTSAWIKKNLTLLLLPAFFWILRYFFWSSTREYHSITSNKVIGLIEISIVFSSILIILAVAYIRSRAEQRYSIFLILVGICVMFVGYLPYLLYGLAGYGLKVPGTYLTMMFGRSDWFSRHQILQPLGLSILIVGLLGLLPAFVRRFRESIVGLILAVAVVFNVAFGFEYAVDYSKQMSVVAALAAKPNRTEGDEIQMVDQTTFLNARQRSYRERDWVGLVGLAEGIDSAKKLNVVGGCSENPNTRLVLIQGPRTHWEALKNWVSDGDMGFKVSVDDTPGACKPEMVTNQRSSGAIPILFYFTGAKG